MSDPSPTYGPPPPLLAPPPPEFPLNTQLRTRGGGWAVLFEWLLLRHGGGRYFGKIKRSLEADWMVCEWSSCGTGALHRGPMSRDDDLLLRPLRTVYVCFAKDDAVRLLHSEQQLEAYRAVFPSTLFATVEEPA